MNAALDVIAALCFVIASVFALIAAIGMARFPDLLTRMHAATKPQVVGLFFALVGLGCRLRDPSVIPLLLLVALFQGATSPISAHMLSRASFRAGHVRTEDLTADELSGVLEKDEPRGAP